MIVRAGVEAPTRIPERRTVPQCSEWCVVCLLLLCLHPFPLRACSAPAPILGAAGNVAKGAEDQGVLHLLAAHHRSSVPALLRCAGPLRAAGDDALGAEGTGARGTMGLVSFLPAGTLLDGYLSTGASGSGSKGASPVAAAVAALLASGAVRKQLVGRLGAAALFCYDPRGTVVAREGYPSRGVLLRPASFGDVAAGYNRVLHHALEDAAWDTPDAAFGSSGGGVGTATGVAWGSLLLVVSGWMAFMPRYRNAVVEAAATAAGSGDDTSGKGKEGAGSSPLAGASHDDDAVGVLTGVSSLALSNLTRLCGVRLPLGTLVCE
jgi:hypothetical protein